MYGLRNTTLCADGYPVDLTLMPEMWKATQNHLMADMCEVYGTEYYYQIFEKMGVKDFRNDFGENITACVSEVPADILRIIEACNDVMYTAMPELVMAETDEEFAAIRDDVLAQLKDLDEEKAWNWYKENWEAPKNYFNSILDSVLDYYGLEKYVVE